MQANVKPRAAVTAVAEFLGLRPGEFDAVAWSFAYFFCIFSAYAMLRPIRDAMVVVSGVSTIPWLFTGTLTVMILVAPIFGWIASRFPRKQFLPWVYYFFIANILIFFAVFTYAQNAGLEQVWIGRSFFVWLSVFNLFVVTIFWSFMADIYTGEQSRRLFGVISAGGSTGGLVGPFITGILVIPLGFKNILPLSALLLLGGVFCIYRLRRWVRQHDQVSDPDTVESSKAIGGGALEGVRLVFTTPYFGAIAFALSLATFMGVVTYNYMQELAGIAFEATDRRTQVFSWIDLATNALSFIGQIILVKHSVNKLGIGATLALLPVVSIIGFALLAIHPVFAIMAGLVILRRSLAFGFSKPASDMLYAVVSAGEKYKVKSFVETAIYRSGDAFAAWIIALSGIGLSAIALVCIPIAVVWTAMSFFIGREYNRRGKSQLSTESA
jgi:AAA family ATP:ADP antiporter